MAGKLKPPDKRVPTCFGIPHAGFFKFFIVVNLGQNLIGIGLVSYEIYIVAKALQVFAIDPIDQQIRFYLRVIAWIWFSSHCVASCGMDFKLFRSADMPSTLFLRLYALIQCVSLSLLLLLYYSLLIEGGSVLPYPPVLITLLLPAHVIYRLYTSYIVYRYSRDIDFELKMKSGYRPLTDEEIFLFENGMKLDDQHLKQKYLDSCYETAQFQAYKREEFEIDQKYLDFSESTTLGCGEYGCVYKVIWKKDGENIPVAVKTVDPEMSDVTQFKALLSEAKVMMCMGQHENIVCLLGICTEEIRERKLYIVCELCQFGNLRAHLRSERNTFINLFDNNKDNDCKINVEINESMSTMDLIKWAYQIAAGMEFLAARKIVHGDLAARNVLLTSSKTAKITDFGLSRRLYNYSVYKKRHNVPLPWRWLAVESLVDMSFSTHSDVWSFGVVCWEIFELGASPWPEFQQFTSEFIEALKDGKVPGKGKYCSDEIYEVMCSCWNGNRKDRPGFAWLKDFFGRKIEEFKIPE